MNDLQPVPDTTRLCDCLWPEALLTRPDPWFLGEPSMHPEAVALVAMAHKAISDGLRETTVSEEALTVWRWGETSPASTPGIAVRWEGRIVLLATYGHGPAREEVWIYRTGVWEESLLNLEHAQTADRNLSTTPTTPDYRAEYAQMVQQVWTGGAFPGHLTTRPQTKET